jgi:ankyrin repeat protein
MSKDPSAVQKVLDTGANPNQPINKDSSVTPLFYAVRNIEIMKLLVSRGADPNIKVTTGVFGIDWRLI